MNGPTKSLLTDAERHELIQRQAAEIERLTAALRAILAETTVSDEAEHLRYIAAAALTGGKP